DHEFIAFRSIRSMGFSRSSRASEQKAESAKETTPASKLRRSNPNAAAISQLVAFVEQIDDIEPVLDAFKISHRKIKGMSKTDVQRRIAGQMLRIGKAAAQAASRHHIGIESRVLQRAFSKTVRTSPRPGNRLIVIEMNIV